MIWAGKFTGWGYADLLLMPSDFWRVIATMITEQNAEIERHAREAERQRRR